MRYQLKYPTREPIFSLLSEKASAAADIHSTHLLASAAINLIPNNFLHDDCVQI